MSKPFRLNSDFYAQEATIIAPALLGKFLCKKTSHGIIKHRITETECYFGAEDTACHAHKGKTPRNSLMYFEGGFAYIYLCYGIHCLLNIITGNEGHPEGVLIRALDGISGPGKLTKALNIDRELNGCDLRTSNMLWLEDDGFKPAYKALKRVGINYASEFDRERLWRYLAY